MAIQLKLRHDIAANWTSTNPTLSIGEPGVEYDTGQFKIGDGTTAWNSLAYQSSTGPAQTIPFRSMGDGSDGNVTISSGTTTLTRDMYYNTLTISGSGVIVTNGYKIFIKTLLDITSAPVGAIKWNGNVGGNASGSSAAGVPAAQPGGSVGDINQGGTGATGDTGGGSTGTGGTIGTGSSNGGISGAGGHGGSGDSGNGGSAGATRTPSADIPLLRYITNFILTTNLLSGGCGGSGGGSGSGDGINNGGAGGSGGNGGGLVAIYARSIRKSSSTPAGVIQANGGNGGNGGTVTVGTCGGGAGGGGGGGGYVYLVYDFLYGPIIPGAIQANGGIGGKGGTASGTTSTATGGAGANSGGGGRIDIINKVNNIAKDITGQANVTIMPELVGYSPNLNTTIALVGGNGGFNGTLSVDL